MSLYERVADLPLVVEESDRARNERDTSSGFLRKSTTITLTGEGAAGRGEDVTYDGEDHDALADVPAFVGEDGIVPGSYTFDEFSAAVDDLDLFPTKPPEREASPHYRRWAVESAGLDLALRQAGRSLGDVLGRTYDPVRFVVSTRLDGDAARLERLREHDPDAEFKLDPTEEWDDDLIAAVQTVGGVRVLDFKAFYEGTDVDSDPSPALYERLVAAFPDAVIEDAAVDDGPFDAITLDTGDAPDVVARAPDLLADGGHVAVYSPFVENSRESVQAARDAGLVDVETYETIQREMDFGERGSRPSTAGVGHTGYLTFARNE